MSSVVKLGMWGQDYGTFHDITVAPCRLESITIRAGDVVDSLAFSYRDQDNVLWTAGPWGGNGGNEHTITLADSEFVTQVTGLVVNYNYIWAISSLRFVTNHGTYGPFGRSNRGESLSLPVLDAGSIVGMFVCATDVIRAIGFYVK